ncbi:Ileal sodium/bile acid cotransporter (Apical sodium-dependent bile acid transporter) (ASBT) (Ileal Na(+)/bile acid cotransporter) (Ileal sodium-dependent bile acid transporter) (IBAT) (ISBT) (Na(+)-dependent ileal bile acid transporter) (Sodium/taurocholate cotransporting polypeptide [Durusdinium trenchii]|uniref:Ileal (Solute carrier family 10 member 2 n=1 Tax=Durusdinium trenchii TaxID=1381693 RepID=A0ABP0IIZ9_9DINO
MQLVFAIIAQVLLFLLLAGLSGSVDIDLLRQRFRQKTSIAFGVACQFIVLPCLGFSAAKAFQFDPVVGIMLITVTSSPGGAYSNWWCSVCNADLALSIAMTTCSTVLSCGLTPLNMLLYTYGAYGESLNFNFFQLVQPVMVAAAAIFSGLLVSYCIPKSRRICNIVGNICGILLITLNVLVSSRDDPVWDKDLIFYVGVGLPCVCSVLVALGLAKVSCRVSAPEAVAIAVEVCYQNTGLAMAIALSAFDKKDASRAAGVPLFYAFLQVCVLPMFLLVAWKSGQTYAPSKDPIWRVIFYNYQPKHNVQAWPSNRDLEAPKANQLNASPLGKYQHQGDEENAKQSVHIVPEPDKE